MPSSTSFKKKKKKSGAKANGNGNDALTPEASTPTLEVAAGVEALAVD